MSHADTEHWVDILSTLIPKRNTISDDTRQTLNTNEDEQQAEVGTQ